MKIDARALLVTADGEEIFNLWWLCEWKGDLLNWNCVGSRSRW